MTPKAAVSMVFSCSRMPVRGAAIAMTASPHALMSSLEQLPSRLWRHPQHIHTDAAARCDIAGAPDGGAQSFATIFSRPAVCLALAQHVLLHMSHCGVPEARAMPHAPAAAVLAATLECAMRAVGGLVRAGLAPELYSFDTCAVSGAVQRMCAALSVANGTLTSEALVGFTSGSGTLPTLDETLLRRSSNLGKPSRWGLAESLQRLAFEVGRCVMGRLGDGASREALAKLMLQAMGRHLGCLLNGRLDTAAVAAARAVLDAPPPLPAVAARWLADGAMAGMEGTAAAATATSSGGGIRVARGGAAGSDGLDMDVVEAWGNYSGRNATDLTSLRVSLAGRIAPREMNLLLATLLGVLPPSDSDAEGSGTMGGTGGSYWYRHYAAAAGLIPSAEPTPSGGAESARDRTASGYGPDSLGTPPGAAVNLPGATSWLVPRPLGRREVMRQVRALVAAKQQSSVGTDGGELRAMENSLPVLVPGAAPPPGAPPLPHVNLGSLPLELLDDCVRHWGYGEIVRPAAAALLGGYFCGGHVALVGSNTPMVVSAGCLAALSTGASLARIDRPTVHRANGSMPDAQLEEHSIRFLLLHHLRAALQALTRAALQHAAAAAAAAAADQAGSEDGASAAGGAAFSSSAIAVAGGLLPYSHDMAVAAGGFSVPGMPYIESGDSEPAALVEEVAAAIKGDAKRQSVANGATSSLRSTGDGEGPEQDPTGMQVILLTDGVLQVCRVRPLP